MRSSKIIRLQAIKPHWRRAWICVALIALTACFTAMADGIRSWSVLGVYLIAAASLFISIQPWRSFLELTPDGFRIVWGVQSTFIRWRDVGGLRPVLAANGQYGGVAFSAARLSQTILGWRRTLPPESGTLSGAFYGVSDGRLYQIMYELRARALERHPDAETESGPAPLAKRPAEVVEG